MNIYDKIHGDIFISEIAKQIVDTRLFQRLRRIHQTGCMYIVFPNATHNRFEHSIGTYHLAKKMITNIKNLQPELKITEKLVELVGIAGLCHDLGHLMYSHLFDHLFLNKLENKEKFGKLIDHEYRSIFYLKYLINKNNIPLDNQDINVISSLIEPKEENYDDWKKEFKVGRWIFEIISNNYNGIDVDKFDYMARDTASSGISNGFDFNRILIFARVINDHICYPIKIRGNIFQMYELRFNLHRYIYNHKTVKAAEILLVDILFEAEKKYNISEWIVNPEKILKLTDEWIYYSNNELINSLVDKIENRKLPKLVAETTFKGKNINSIPKISNLPSAYSLVDFRAGYLSGKSNPLNNIFWYKRNRNSEIKLSKIKDFSLLLNDEYYECVLRIYQIEKSNNPLILPDEFDYFI